MKLVLKCVDTKTKPLLNVHVEWTLLAIEIHACSFRLFFIRTFEYFEYSNNRPWWLVRLSIPFHSYICLYMHRAYVIHVVARAMTCFIHRVLLRFGPPRKCCRVSHARKATVIERLFMFIIIRPLIRPRRTTTRAFAQVADQAWKCWKASDDDTQVQLDILPNGSAGLSGF